MDKNILFYDKKSIYFMGIGGISMSGLAELLNSKGYTVSGSDNKQSEITEHLESLGIKIAYGQKASNITSDIDLVVYTAAIHPDNPEFVAAKEAGIPLMRRATLLGQVMSQYKHAINVSGTHGKTTTTSMISQIFLEAGTDPTIAVGGVLKGIKGNMHIGGTENFIAEACEYTNSFLEFFPTTAVILNIEAEHLDFFKDLNDIRNSFTRFASLVPDSGLVVINKEIETYKDICKDTKAKVVTYGLNSSSDYNANDITYNKLGHGSFDLVVRGKEVGRVDLSVVGAHNISNALAALAVALEHGIDFETAARGLNKYTGTDRRFQYKGERDGVTIIDDYAHHPTEVRATLNAALKVDCNEIWVVFQPHTYSRTKALLPDFIEALSLANHVVLAKIYAAREADPGDISSADLAAGLISKGIDCTYLSTFEEIEKFLINNCKHGDLLITMGAGDIVNVGEKLLQM